MSSKYHYDRVFFRNPVCCGDISIYQIGEIYCRADTNFDRHKQMCDEISFIISGKGIFEANGKPMKVQKGDCVLSYKDEIHFIESNAKEPLRFYYIGFDAEKLASLKPLKESGMHLFSFAQAEELFSKIIDEIYNQRPFGNEMIGALLQSLVICLARQLGVTQKQKVPQDKSSISLVYQITNFLHTHITEPDAGKRLEEEFHYNYAFLARHFSDVMGETLRSYIYRTRMEYADKLLSEGKSVTEVSEILGYSTVHPFSRAYKKHFGITPHERFVNPLL